MNLPDVNPLNFYFDKREAQVINIPENHYGQKNRKNDQ